MIKQDSPETAVWRWHKHNFRAMNTDMHLSLATSAPEKDARTVVEIFHYYEQLLSRFRSTSELSRLNAWPGPQFQASPDFFAAVQAALWAAQQTDGLYDPTILDFLEAAGYDQSFETLARRRPLSAETVDMEFSWPTLSPAAPDPNTGPNYQQFSLDFFALLIGRPVGLRIDLGGMGKGWTVDRAADFLCPKGHFLLNAGGDLYAYGSPGSGQGWTVYLGHPWKQDLKFATLMVDRQAVATSTTARRRWEKEGTVRHHLIDPRSGCPADSDAVSVSVIGSRVFTAEILAKAALILGIADGLAFLEGWPDVEGAFFSSAQEVHFTSGMDRYLNHVDPGGYAQDGQNSGRKE